MPMRDFEGERKAKMNKYDKCPNCMQSVSEGESICHYCGFDIGGYEEKPNCLKPFTVLQGKYMIGRVIGVGGFGITYIGWDVNLQTYIAIKEYYPVVIRRLQLSSHRMRAKRKSMTKD